MVGLRLTLEDAIQAAARYTAQELLAGNTIEQPWPIRVGGCCESFQAALTPTRWNLEPFLQKHADSAKGQLGLTKS